MQNHSKAKIVVLAAMCACVFVKKANAECGAVSKFNFGTLFHQQSWDSSDSSHASLFTVAQSGEPIVGFWKVTFTAEGNPGIPNGTVIDQAYAQWHSDGTEIMNSSRPPVTQNFCLGVWKNTGGLKYKLNHFAIVYDSNSNLIGSANIRENVVLSTDGENFSGSFTIDQFDLSANNVAHITGQLAGKRITVDSSASVAF
jgi:hypothetical protein